MVTFWSGQSECVQLIDLTICSRVNCNRAECQQIEIDPNKGNRVEMVLISVIKLSLERRIRIDIYRDPWNSICIFWSTGSSTFFLNKYGFFLLFLINGICVLFIWSRKTFWKRKLLKSLFYTIFLVVCSGFFLVRAGNYKLKTKLIFQISEKIAQKKSH